MLVLALLLFFPISRLVWVLSVRRLQRKQRRELSRTEIDGQLMRARVIAGFVALTFSCLFNLSFLGVPGRG